MWSLIGKNLNEASVEPRFRVLEGLPSRQNILAELNSLLTESPARPVLSTIEREFNLEGVLQGVDRISTWGPEAVSLFEAPTVGEELRFGPIGEPGQGYNVQALTWSETAETDLSAWHEPGTLIIDVTGLTELEFYEKPSEYLASDHTKLPQPEAFLDWRGYFGENTLTVEDEEKLEPQEYDIEGRSKITLKLAGTAGVIIGTIVRWLGQPRKPSRDYSQYPRLKYYESKLPHLEKAYPSLTNLDLLSDINLYKPIKAPTLVVIHGTFSCALPILSKLDPLNIKAFRFEHDTFKSISDNAKKLTELVRKYLQSDPLIIVGHSRGGLVARLAARDLFSDHNVMVRTYGTPHLGTPLANAGAKGFRALASCGGIFLKNLEMDPATAVLRYLFRPRDLPSGLSVMRTDSETLKAMNIGSEQFELRSYGGTYDVKSYPDGKGTAFMQGFAKGAFDRKKNDLVVPTSSALGAGNGKDIPGSCAHSQYFDIPDIVKELREL